MALAKNNSQEEGQSNCQYSFQPFINNFHLWAKLYIIHINYWYFYSIISLWSYEPD